MSLSESPLIVSLEMDSDPGNALALACVAFSDPHLTAVVSAAEVPGNRRAAFARHLLDLLGRDDVQVIAGKVQEQSTLSTTDGLYPLLPYSDDNATSLYQVVTEMCSAGDASKPLRWLGLGPLTDLAALLAADAGAGHRLDLTQRMHIWQSGGALAHPQRPERNFQADPHAVQNVLSQASNISLITSEHSMTAVTELDTHSPIYHQLAAASYKQWAKLMTTHIDRWCGRGDGTVAYLHGALTFAAMRGQFATWKERQFDLAGNGCITSGTQHAAQFSAQVDYPGFLRWLEATLYASKPARRPDWDRLLDTLAAAATLGLCT
ncbi:nucleoside hydrolase [Nocardia sp. NPDC049220]|uniref:nucleoside hydrolase n=1 Tax=Nocardia sp. NPDC049220 TaxID=3155273 RepID=UPI0033EA918C